MKLKTKLVFKVLNKHQVRLTEMNIEQARDYFEKISVKSRIIKDVTTEDMNIGKTSKKLNIRIYKPPKKADKAIVFFHGGGFVLGSIESHDNVAKVLCKKLNCVLISVDYRLAPENPYPAAEEDGIDAVSWLLERKLPGVNEIYLSGDSAGGSVALGTYFGLAEKDKKSIKGIILFYPCIDPKLSTKSANLYAENYFITKENMKFFWEIYLGGQSFEYPFSKQQLLSLPPVLMEVADLDLLRDDGKNLAKEINEHGGKCQYYCHKNTFHGFMQIPSAVSGRNKAIKDVKLFLAQ